MPDSCPGPEEARLLEKLKEHDIQLAFLALLTIRRIKPASRWEKPLPPELAGALRDLGLAVLAIRRSTRSGRQVVETLFSLDAGRLEEYAARFDGRPLDKSRETRRFEGRFLGYPVCCIEAFIASPYTPNQLAEEDQAILFHWACPGCAETPGILEKYRALRDHLDTLGKTGAWPSHG